MRPHFTPNRQGAQHVLDEQDVVIVRGTPVFQRETGSRDTRIRISRNGYAERALWIRLPIPPSQTGRHNEFHLWDYLLAETTIAKIDSALQALALILPETSELRDPNDVVRSIRFWHGGHQIYRAMSLPRDHRLTEEQAAAFQTAWEVIHAAVPEGD